MKDLLLLYLVIINAAGFGLMLADKRKAKKNLWRIPEATLMTVAALGGSVGSLLGMYTVRHKTRHPKVHRRHPAASGASDHCFRRGDGEISGNTCVK